jgi:hypothetical protein
VRCSDRNNGEAEPVKKIGKGFSIGVLALGMSAAVIPLAATSASGLAATTYKTTGSAKLTDSKKAPYKCTAKALGPAIKAVAQGSPYKVNAVGCSGSWAYVVFTSGGTKQVDVLAYLKSLTTWIADNTTTVCAKNILPSSIKAEACKSGISQAQ